MGGCSALMKNLLVGLPLIIASLAGVSFANEIALFETQSAVASFVGEESPCVRTLTGIFASNHIERPQKAPVSGAFISIKKENYCAGTLLLDAVGVPVFNASEFTVKGNLKQAALNATFPVFDFVTNAQVMIAVKLSWTNAGRAVRAWSLTSDDFLFIVAKEAKKTYLATASGQVSSDNENFTPSPSQNGVVSVDDNLFIIRE
jgi:hypothetical protein